VSTRWATRGGEENGCGAVDPNVRLRQYSVRALILFAAFPVFLGAVGCAASSAVGPGALDPNGRARTSAAEMFGTPVNTALAVRIPMGSTPRNASYAWFARDGMDARVDFLADVDGMSIKRWMLIVPSARPEGFDAVLKQKSELYAWDAPVSLPSGVREACMAGDKLFHGCVFGFPNGALVAVDADSAARARDEFSSSTDLPPGLTISDHLYVSIWSSAKTATSDAKLTGDQARLVDGFVASTLTLDDQWKLSAAIEYVDGSHASDAEDAYKKLVAASLHDTSSKVAELLRAPVFDEHVDDSRLVVVVDFKALVEQLVDAIKKIFAAASAE
jgi:hypothetical protein